MQLHVESQHAEGGRSPFIVKDDASVAALVDLDASNDVEYVHCPVEGCGEDLLLAELESHIEMHEEEQETEDSETQSSRSPKRLKLEPQIVETFDIKLTHALRNLADADDRPVSAVPSPDRHSIAKAAWKKVLKIPESSSKVSSTSRAPTRRRLGVNTFLQYNLSRDAHHATEIGIGAACT